MQSILSFVKSVPATKPSQNSQKADHDDNQMVIEKTSNGKIEQNESPTK